MISIQINEDRFILFVQDKVGRMYWLHRAIQQMDAYRPAFIEFRKGAERIQFDRGLDKEPVEEGEDAAKV